VLVVLTSSLASLVPSILSTCDYYIVLGKTADFLFFAPKHISKKQVGSVVLSSLGSIGSLVDVPFDCRAR
jgi:hypothetical protein